MAYWEAASDGAREDVQDTQEAQDAIGEGIDADTRAFATLVRLLWPRGAEQGDPVAELAHTLARPALHWEVAEAEALLDAVSTALGAELTNALHITIEAREGVLAVVGGYHRSPLLFEWQTLTPRSWAALICERVYDNGVGAYRTIARVTFTTAEEFVRALVVTLAARRRAE